MLGRQGRFKDPRQGKMTKGKAQDETGGKAGQPASRPDPGQADEAQARSASPPHRPAPAGGRLTQQTGQAQANQHIGTERPGQGLRDRPERHQSALAVSVPADGESECPQKKTKERTTTFLRQGASSGVVGSMQAVWKDQRETEPSVTES